MHTLGTCRLEREVEFVDTEVSGIGWTEADFSEAVKKHADTPLLCQYNMFT